MSVNMKSIIGMFLILTTVNLISTQDDPQFDNDDPNPDENPPQDPTNMYPDDEQDPMKNYPPPNQQQPNQGNYPPQIPQYDYPPPPPQQNQPPQYDYPPPPPQQHQNQPPQYDYPPPPPQQNQPPQYNYPPPPPQQNDNAIRCECGEIAKKTVVRKDSPNKGREMYVCPKNRDDPDRCNFFMWGDGAGGSGGGGGGGGGGGRRQWGNRGGYGRSGGYNIQRGGYKPKNQYNQQYGGGGPNGPSAYNQPKPNYGRPNDPAQPPTNEDIICNCGAPAKKYVVKKDTPNKGREFYCCQRMRDDPERCNFFLWAS